ncbi:TonB-dependent receptor [Paraglaciecola arctica]|uniref:TonB-dependent receptor n=1 Tax=Paraglaciecola arctica TaxID=1128911 RepID=UPI001C07D915|nr:TonB-dependent receptor [Paraglaciecola arctica]MBU3005436.1 TonB-dependent receptor [Paraglaciecola arctica]
MNNSKKHNFKLNKITKTYIAMGTAILTFSGYAQAQQAEVEQSAEDVELIQVTGIRSQLTQAVATKRDSVQFVDAISADDMGKLPDANVAESLQRVSGVQLERGIGEGSTVSIRGLSQNVILVNGRQVTTAGGRGDKGPDTLESSSYSMLSLIPSSLVSSLEVSKLPSASQIEGALGGVVNIKTRRPLDNDGQKIVASATGSYNDLSKDNGSEVSVYYSNSFLDNTLGIQVAASRASSTFQEEGLNTFSGYSYDASVTADPNEETLVFNDMRYWEINDKREKTGLNAMIQWQTSDSLELYLDTFYSKVDSDRDRFWTGFWTCCGYENTEISDNGVLTAASINRPVQANTEYAPAYMEFTSTALGFKWFAEDWEVEGELARTDSTSNSQQDFMRFQTAEAAAVDFDLLAGDDAPDVIFGGADLTSPDGLNLAIVYDNTSYNENVDTAVRLDFTRYFDGDFFTSIEFGGRANSFETDHDYVARAITPNFALTDLPQIYTMYNNSNFFSGDGPAVNHQYLIVDKNKWQGCTTLSEFYDEAQTAECATTHDLSPSYNITEDLIALYTQANFSSEVGGYAISGNFGVRYVQRDLTSEGHSEDVTTGVATPFTTKVSHSELLPSAVVKMDLTDDVVLRFGAARTLTFPDTSDLSSGIFVRGDFTANGGNPELDPFVINQLDFSAEWYFGESSILSAGLFYKDVESFIVNTIQPRDLPNYSQQVFVEQPINGESGTIQGLEVLYQQAFTSLPGFLKDTGVMATYSYIDSETPFEDGRGNSLPIPGLSENNINMVVYYEVESFGMRLAYNWRDSYLGYLGAGDNGVFYKSYQDLAATANYKINDNVSLNFQALNLLDTRQKQYAAYEEAIQRNVEFGRSYKLSVSVNF